MGFLRHCDGSAHRLYSNHGGMKRRIPETGTAIAVAKHEPGLCYSRLIRCESGVQGNGSSVWWGADAAVLAANRVAGLKTTPHSPKSDAIRLAEYQLCLRLFVVRILLSGLDRWGCRASLTRVLRPHGAKLQPCATE